MNETHDRLPATCDEARQAVQERLDGPLDADVAGRLERHLGECSDCREYQRDLAGLQRSLRAMPELSFPRDALEQVLDRTVRATTRTAKPRGRVAGSVWFAAAAVVVITALLVVWNNINAPGTPPSGINHTVSGNETYSPAEIEQAALEAQQVLALTAQALQRGSVAAGKVLKEDVSPALQRTPIRWGARDGADRDPGRS